MNYTQTYISHNFFLFFSTIPKINPNKIKSRYGEKQIWADKSDSYVVAHTCIAHFFFSSRFVSHYHFKHIISWSEYNSTQTQTPSTSLIISFCSGKPFFLECIVLSSFWSLRAYIFKTLIIGNHISTSAFAFLKLRNPATVASHFSSVWKNWSNSSININGLNRVEMSIKKLSKGKNINSTHTHTHARTVKYTEGQTS